MEKDQLILLFRRRQEGNIGREEEQALLSFLRDPENREQIEECIGSLLENPPVLPLPPSDHFDEMLARIYRNTNAETPGSKHRVHFMRRWWAAASVLLIVTVAYWFSRPSTSSEELSSSSTIQEIAPGTSGALLTLADGSVISLDSFDNKTVVRQGAVTARVVNGSLIYEGHGDAVTYNVMSTPKGRQFQLLLPDGTQVWLNAASSIRYPTSFNEQKRMVEITGEAYFEVAKNHSRPFLVNVNGKAEIEVLGTAFNINAYANEEKIETTLLEGSVSVSNIYDGGSPDSVHKQRHRIVLKPGEQVRLSNAAAKNSIQVAQHADIEKVMAWKRGLFNFEGLPLSSVMKQLERWYDINTKYDENTGKLIFRGELYRNLPLKDALEILKDMGIKYELEGRNLTILGASW